MGLGLHLELNFTPKLSMIIVITLFEVYLARIVFSQAGRGVAGFSENKTNLCYQLGLDLVET